MDFFFKISMSKFRIFINFQKRNIAFFLLAVQFWSTEISKTWVCIWFFLRFQLICLQKYRLEFFHHDFSGQLHLCRKLLDNYLCSLCLYSCIEIRKKLSVVAFCYSETFFSKSTDWTSTIKISRDSFKFSENDPEIYFMFRTLLRSRDKSIMPRIAEINGGINIYRKPLKTGLRTLICFSSNNCKNLSKISNRAKNMPVLADRIFLSFS